MYINKMNDKSQSSLQREKPLIIGISGKRGTGKTFYGRLMATTYKSTVKVFAFADVLKDYVRQWFNLSKEHTDGKLKEKPTNYSKGMHDFAEGANESHEVMWTPREIMIEVGQFFRKFDKMFWVKKVFERIKALRPHHMAVITDVRFKNEADAIKAQDGLLIRLERDPKLTPYEGDITDISETDLDDYDKFDFIVKAENNRNPQDAEKAIEKIMKEISSNANSPKII